MYKYLLSGFFLIFILNINSVVSQTSGGGAPGAVAPTAPSPGDFPPTIIYPENNLNQFENSSLNETKTKFRHGQSTLNPVIIQKSFGDPTIGR